MELGSLFDSISAEMQNELTTGRAAIDKHPGVKGAIFEDIFRNFLRRYLPKRLDVSTGFLVDSEGTQSKQQDIIVSDSAKTPIFYAMEQLRVVPAECAYAVVQVKAYLRNDDLPEILENMKSVKSLKKVAWTREGGIAKGMKAYGEDLEIVPTFYLIFAYDSDDLETIKNSLQIEYDKGIDVKSRIDSICVLNKGVICNRRASGEIELLPTPDSTMHVAKTVKALLFFYTIWSYYFNQQPLPNFQLNRYIDNVRFF